LVLVGSCSGFFYAFDAESGELRWKYDTSDDGDAAQFHGDPLLTENLVVTGSDRSTLSCTYAFIQQTGEMIWKQSEAAFESDLCLVASQVVGRRWNGDLIALDLETGDVRWTVPPQDYTYRFREDDSPIVKGEVVYFGGVDGYVYAVDGLQGRVVWKSNVGTRITTTPAAGGQDIYFGTAAKKLYRFSGRDGSRLGEANCTGKPFGRLALTEDALIVLVDQSTLAAYDRTLNRVRWTQEGDPRWSSNQPLIWREMVVVGTSDGKVSAFDISDGREVLSLSVDGMVRGLGASENILFIGTYGGTLYAHKWDEE
jgi:outer membrane protein assembly factor BamB